MIRPVHLALLLLMTGCKRCEERRHARTLEELTELMTLDPVEVEAAQVAREDGGVEAWGDSVEYVRFAPPEGYSLELWGEEPAWSKAMNGSPDHCPDDVPLAWFGLGSTINVDVEEGYGMEANIMAGGCDADGEDLAGSYGVIIPYTAILRDAEDERWDLELAVEVELRID